MIKIIIEIKEKDIYNMNKLKATGIEVNFKEGILNATNSEKEVAEIIRKRINPEDKEMEIIDKTSNKKLDKLMEIINNL